MNIVIYVVLAIVIVQLLFALIIMPYFKHKRDVKISKEQKDLYAALKVGHEVLLASGIYGTIIRKNKDHLIIKIAPNTNIKVTYQAIIGFFDRDIAKAIKNMEIKKQKNEIINKK